MLVPNQSQTSVPTSKSKLFAYIDPEDKQALERLAEIRNRSVSNLVETLIKEELDRARENGELPKSQSEGK